MPRTPPRPSAALAGNTPDEVEAQFYEALQRADLELLMAVWADDDEIVCVHPGGGRVIGTAAIRASFEAIFGNGAVPAQPEQVRRLQWLGGALHHLVERIEVPAAGDSPGPQTAWVLATNVYVKTPQGWRLAAHHASPGSLQEMPGPGEAPATLH
ncbi:MAG: nuclear transport factor 2 family protein [Burkholderiales bacterium]|nr:nuclear transport factor 2 family protein [Burkholderiales bacterium]